MSASDHLNGQQFYHVAWDDDRDSIRQNGLRTGSGEGAHPGRVWLYSDLGLARNDSAGSDIWHVSNPPNVAPGHKFSDESQHADGNTWASDAVPPQNLRLIESRH